MASLDTEFCFSTTLEDLVEIFEEEAEKACSTQTEARILACEALTDFLNTYSKDVIVG